MPQTYYTATPDKAARFQCRHIFPDGRRCASPCLRTQELCYYHHTTRRPIADPHARLARTSTFGLPSPADLTDRAGIQLAIAEVLHRIASNDIDPRRAGLLLYGLQVASLNLAKPPAKPQPSILVDDTVEDPDLGTLAPRALITDLVPRTGLELYLETFGGLMTDQTPPEPELESDAEPLPITLPDLQATSTQSTPNPNLLRSLPPNPGRGPRHHRNATVNPPQNVSSRPKAHAGVPVGRSLPDGVAGRRSGETPVFRDVSRPKPSEATRPPITFPQTPRLTRISPSRSHSCAR